MAQEHEHGTQTGSRATTGWAAFAATAVVLFALLVWLLVVGPATTPAADVAETPEEPTAEPADEEAEPAGEAVTVGIELGDMYIDPDEIEVPADTPVAFELENVGGAEHDFEIDGVGGSPMVQPGETLTWEVDGIPEGEHGAICTVPGHEGAGMTATVVATPDAEVAAEPAATDEEGDGTSDGGDSEGDEEGSDATESGDHGDMTPEEMVEVHDGGVADFPAETEGQGGEPLEPEIDDDGTLVWELTAEHVEWEVEPGDVREGMGYNGMIPGPELRAEVGDDVRIELTNELDEPTALHMHHLAVPNEMDGVPGLTQDSILPGETFTYEFTVDNDGSHMYHSHFDSARQVPGGLLGAFVVEDEDPDAVDADHDVTMILNDGPLGYTINGKGFPATEPIEVEQGETVRVRYMNEGLEIHPMHLHGMRQEVIAYDGDLLEQTHTEDTVNVAPGERVDVLIEATEPGAWAFHCHVLSHAEGSDGMFGMVTAMIVE
ncbi:hypothetical protein ER308_12785 [Egibacter rhizosphaerae]|uniref:Copper oxidase n=1 Tax=Egibacter rhizosphaerae TaxID=1670831 RepID=A0A411YGM2_9ACTN|nr:multicopper oxidase domain-containing protein [Egibacter rhizosphaerae]QBI20353.1 hypothetical protein ER308_12785 [Egibacter rhizosphaerae]